MKPDPKFQSFFDKLVGLGATQQARLYSKASDVTVSSVNDSSSLSIAHSHFALNMTGKRAATTMGLID